MGSDSTVRTTVRLNPALKQELVALARREGKTLTEILHEAGWLWLERRSRPEASERLKIKPLPRKSDVPIDFEAVKRQIELEDEEWARKQMGEGLGVPPRATEVGA